MEAIFQIVSAASATEFIRVLWMEIAMASFAATLFFTFSGWLRPAKKVKSMNSPRNRPGQTAKASRKALDGSNDLEVTSHQHIAKALRQGDVSCAISLLQELPEVSSGSVPANLAPRLLMAAAKSTNFEEVMEQLQLLVGKIESRSLEAVVLEAAKNKDVAAGRKLQVISQSLAVPKSNKALEAFAKLLASDAACLRSLMEEAEAPLSRCFAKALLEACTALKDIDLAAEVFEKIDESDAAMLRNIVEKAATTASSPAGTSKDANPDMCLLRNQIAACSKEIRTRGKDGDLEGAIKLFEEQRSVNTAFLYNSILEACVECGNIDKAMAYFDQARSKSLVDAVSYNTAMKGHLSQGDVSAARTLFAELSEKGLSPTLASYHGFLNFYVNAGKNGEAWKMLEEMQSSGIAPTAVTCSILLKSKMDSANMSKILAIVDTIKPLDEVLFHSLAEACIRTGQLHLLAKYQTQLRNEGTSTALSAPTYGSMIKAHGHAYNVQQVWCLWEEMIKHKVQPTAVTLGCMVEALVTNWCTADAWTLVKELRAKDETKALVNTVIYSTILKGFANAKETDKVVTLYEEMKAEGAQPNNITFNTVLNAFAQGGAMDRVPALLADMKNATPPAEPDIVTYSTLIKGYCNSGSLDRALEILKDMQSDGKFTPDEVMYNSLLDGCSKELRHKDALKLLEEMKTNSVAPSNYTLSMLVKLLGRCRRVNQAFTIVEEISRDYGLKVNIQVYTCLIQACFNNKQATKAVALHDQIIKEGLVPDEMTYSVLVLGCLKANLVDNAVSLAKCAYGLSAPKGKGLPAGINARSLDELVSAMGPSSAEAKSLLADIADCKVSGKGGSKGKGKGKAGNGFTETSSSSKRGSEGKMDGRAGQANAPWRQQKQ